MSDGRTHRAIGTLARGGSALAKAQPQRPESILLAVIGGLIAGNLGARQPDVLDPPLHPGHRGVSHGMVPVGTATPLQRLWHARLEILCAGALAELLGGYGSHIALDAFTPAGLPLIA